MRTRPDRTSLRLAVAVLLLAMPSAGLAQSRPAGRPDVPDVDVLQLTPKMARFLVRHVSTKKDGEDQVDDLMDAIFGKKGLRITYESHATLTAAETFEARRGNCLSFTLLFVAMARHMGLEAYFMEVDEVISWNRRGEVTVRNQHMIVEIEIENARRRVDFLPEAEKRYRAVKRISDRRALAHYHNNLGVEALAGGEADLALARFERALAADGTFADAWTNQGVAHRRAGDFAAAEASHLRAIELDRSEPAALANLASLYVATGRAEQAAPLRSRVEDHLKRNPFHHFRLGTVSARLGDPAAAVRHFKEAIRRMPGEGEFHASLAAALARSGELEKARKSYEKALELTGDSSTRERLSAELTALGAPTSR